MLEAREVSSKQKEEKVRTPIILTLQEDITFCFEIGNIGAAHYLLEVLSEHVADHPEDKFLLPDFFIDGEPIERSTLHSLLEKTIKEDGTLYNEISAYFLLIGSRGIFETCMTDLNLQADEDALENLWNEEHPLFKMHASFQLILQTVFPQKSQIH